MDILLPIETSDGYTIETSDPYPAYTFYSIYFDNFDYPLSATILQTVYYAKFYQTTYSAVMNQ